VRFANVPGASDAATPFEVAGYELPIVDYPGQERLGVAKRHNLRLLASVLDGSMIEPGATWSLWRAAGRPTAARGYREAAALREGALTWEVGGAICLLSTVVYNAALLAGFAIVERRWHSVDSYGPARYFELGRDATIEYGYIDLRFRNDGPGMARLRVEATDERVVAAVLTSEPAAPACVLEVTPLEAPAGEIRVRTVRRTGLHDGSGGRRTEDLGVSVYRTPTEATGRAGPTGRDGRDVPA